MVELIAFQNLWSFRTAALRTQTTRHTNAGNIVNKENAYLFHDDRNRDVAQLSIKLKRHF